MVFLEEAMPYTVYLLPVYEAGESLYEILYGRPTRRRGLLYLYTLHVTV